MKKYLSAVLSQTKDRVTGKRKTAASFFDREWYALVNPNVAGRAWRHYQTSGWKEGRDPHPLFDVSWYLAKNGDVAQAGIEPLQHYLKFGWREGRNPHPLFDAAHYLEVNTDVAESGLEPLSHYLKYGWGEGRNPYIADGDSFVRDTPKADGLGAERLTRYTVTERAADGGPGIIFDGAKFTAQNPDALTGVAPLLAYVRLCASEDAVSSQSFDATYYALMNPDLGSMSGAELKTHFRQKGMAEGRIGTPPSATGVRVALQPSTPKAPKRLISGGKPHYSTPLVISGFHRSGTSMTANLFANAGLHLGNKLLGANPSNPYGHFEDTEAVGFHDRLLKQSGTYWQTESDFIPVMHEQDWRWLLNYGVRKSAHPAWGFKDPRNCLFLPQWARVFPEMKVLYVYRPCIQCVHSLKRRAARDLWRNVVPSVNQRFWTIDDLAIHMYLVYARSALRFLNGFAGDSCVVSLESILQGRDIIGEVREHWDYPLADAAIGDIYDSKAMSQSGPNEVVIDPALLDQVREIEAQLLKRETFGFVSGGKPLITKQLEAAS